MATIPGIEEKNKPNYPSPDYKAMRPELEICRDIDAGYLRLRQKGTTYLPQFEREADKDYIVRLNQPLFFNAFTRTHVGLTGMVFRIEPVMGEDVPPRIAEFWENIDNQGTQGNVFLKDSFDDVLVAGHGAILIDVPTVDDPEALTGGDERREGIRPYWVYIKKDDILGIKTVVENGQTKLSQVRIREVVEESDGEFGSEIITQYRVLRRKSGEDGNSVTFELWREIKGKYEVYQKEKPITNVTEIPLVPIYSKREGFFLSRPPLIDLANLNWQHYIRTHDMHHAAHMACVPLLFGKGFKADSIEVGPNSAIIIPQGGADVDAKYLETTGRGVAECREIINGIETQMAIVGLNMLKPETRAAETAEAKRLDKSEQDSALASAAQSLQDGVESALKFTAEFLGLPEGGSIKVNTDFTPDPMSAQLMAEYRNLVVASQLSLETMWSIFEENGALPDDFDPDVEKEQIEAGSMRFMPPEPEPDEEDDDEEENEGGDEDES